MLVKFWEGRCKNGKQFEVNENIISPLQSIRCLDMSLNNVGPKTKHRCCASEWISFCFFGFQASKLLQASMTEKFNKHQLLLKKTIFRNIHSYQQ